MGKSEATDKEIRNRFLSYVVAAGAGELDEWRESASGRLALILLLDQFTRNIYRDTPEAFARDERARELCVSGLAEGADQALRPIERVFFYLPLEHSEDIEDQDRCVALFQQLAEDVPAHWKPAFDGFIDFAIRHQAIIQQFGRFPHRNAILGRESTPEETGFLAGPGSSF